MTDRRPDDWAHMVISWIIAAEEEMDQAYLADDGPAYIDASRRRDEMQQALMVIDPSAPIRFGMADMARGIRRLGQAMVTATAALSATIQAIQKAREQDATRTKTDSIG